MKSKSAARAHASRRKNQENHCPVPRGTLVIIGGKENKGENGPREKKKPSDFIKLEVLKAFCDAINKRDPLVEVITTASDLPNETFSEYQRTFEKLDITRLGHIHHNERREVLHDELTMERVKKADAFFFSGGDQLQLTGVYGGTSFLTVLKNRYINEPIVIGGTSAGAMALSTPMIYGGNSDVQELGGEIKVTTGLEFVKDVCIDTHFVNRGRFVRLAQVVITNPTCIGVGIEEDTALVIQNGRDARVVGTSLVIVIDGLEITATNMKDFSTDRPVTARDLRIHLLSDGDVYNTPEINPPHK